MFREGYQIGLYTLIRKLGKGGFGEVWLAEKRSQFVTKKVAVKLLLDDQTNFETIKREATLWEAASGHANVLPIIDADIYDGQVVIISEYAEGGSLADKLVKVGKFPVKQAVELTIGILNGLDFLHHKKIIHRDIKPQNILLQGGTARLADFGISRVMQTTTAPSSAIVGTDAYMSPEAFDGKRTVQTDIWSVGVVLYQLLKGALPFPQEHPTERIFAILTKEIEPLPNDIPGQLQEIVRQALAKNPAERYQSASAMREDLQSALLKILQPAFAPTEPFSKETLPLAHQFTPTEEEKNLPAPESSVEMNMTTEAFLKQSSLPTEVINQHSQPVLRPLSTGAQRTLEGTHGSGKKGKSLLIFIGAAVFCLLAIGGVIGFLAFNKYSSKNLAADYLNKGISHADQKQYDEAISNFDKALELEPGNSEIYLNRGDAYNDKKQSEKALSDYNKAIELDPNNSRAYRGRGSVYRDKKQNDEALTNYNKAVELDPNNSSFYIQRGLVFYDREQFDKALADFNKAIDLDPNNYKPYNNRGLVFRKQNLPDKAIADFNKVIELDPKNSTAYSNRGLAYYVKSQFEKAFADFEKAIELNPNNSIAFHGRGYYYKDKKQFDKALEDLNRAIELNPNSSTAYNTRGIIYWKMKNPQQARADWRQALEIDPDNKEAKQNLKLN